MVDKHACSFAFQDNPESMLLLPKEFQDRHSEGGQSHDRFNPRQQVGPEKSSGPTYPWVTVSLHLRPSTVHEKKTD